MELTNSDKHNLGQLLAQCAEQAQWDSVMSLIKAGAPIDSMSPRNQTTALMHATDCGVTLMVEWLLTNHAHPDTQGLSGNSALMRAAALGRTDVANILLKHGANPLLKDTDGRTAAHKAADAQHLALASSLRAAEVVYVADDIKKAEEITRTHLTEDLFVAIQQKDIFRVRNLCAAGADVNAQSRSGQSLLNFSMTWKDREEEMLALLDAGANPNLADKTGYLPLTNAYRIHAKHYFILLINHGASPLAPDNKGVNAVMRLAAEGGADVVDYMAARGITLACQDNEGNSPLMIAIANKQFATAKSFFMAGIDANAPNNQGQTAFDLAKRTGAFDTWRMMQEQRAPLAPKDQAAKLKPDMPF